MIRLATISLAAAALALSCAAVAGPGGTTTGRAVVYSQDLNLNRVTDARVLHQRIEAAAARACGGNPLARTWHGQPIGPVLRQYQLCREEAVARTVAQMRLATVQTAYVEKHGHPMDQWAAEYGR